MPDEHEPEACAGAAGSPVSNDAPTSAATAARFNLLVPKRMSLVLSYLVG
ncbi:hypothetical protein [Micromonospora trifolii]